MTKPVYFQPSLPHDAAHQWRGCRHCVLAKPCNDADNMLGEDYFISCRKVLGHYTFDNPDGTLVQVGVLDD